MSAFCPINPPGHDWDNGLTCRCGATRTAAEAIESGLASRRGGDETAARSLTDAHRSEVLAKAIGRLRAIPVTCTALTGPVWYGTGWNEAISVLEDIADYRTPDDEAYPGELQRLRSLALGIRVALRKEVQRVMDAHVAWEKDATRGAR